MEEVQTIRCFPDNRGYDIVDGNLKYGYINNRRFEFAVGNKYQVCHASSARKLHAGAVGVYERMRRVNGQYYAILECCGRRFWIEPAALVPWEGEINAEHLRLITPMGKVHLLQDNRCICKCDSNSLANPTKLCLEEFLATPEKSRCRNCNNIAKRQVSKNFNL